MDLQFKQPFVFCSVVAVIFDSEEFDATKRRQCLRKLRTRQDDKVKTARVEQWVLKHSNFGSEAEFHSLIISGLTQPDQLKQKRYHMQQNLWYQATSL